MGASLSPTISDANDRPLLSIVGADHQWRYPIRLDQMSPWLRKATIAVEDERFYRHFGVDPIAVVRAAGLRRYPGIFPDEPAPHVRALAPDVCRAISEIPSSRQRRPTGMETMLPEDVPWFMWKTGTSSGRRDAWAVGHNRRYAIGVWVGRFRGTGRAAYVGAQAAEPLPAASFNLPDLRRRIDPPSARPIQVYRPLPPPRELNRRLKIDTPTPGDTFICLNGSAIVRARANRTEGISWFLNGKLIPGEMPPSLALPAGEYELRCVDDSGQSFSVAFAVLGAGESNATTRILPHVRRRRHNLPR